MCFLYERGDQAYVEVITLPKISIHVIRKRAKTFGFIAQDINQLYPEFVRIKKIMVDSINLVRDLYSLNYDGFDVIAIKAL